MTPARRRARDYRHERLRATRSGLRVDSRGVISPGDQSTSTPTTTDVKWGHFKRPRWGHCKRPRPTDPQRPRRMCRAGPCGGYLDPSEALGCPLRVWAHRQTPRSLRPALDCLPARGGASSPALRPLTPYFKDANRVVVPIKNIGSGPALDTRVGLTVRDQTVAYTDIGGPEREAPPIAGLGLSNLTPVEVYVPGLGDVPGFSLRIGYSTWPTSPGKPRPPLPRDATPWRPRECARMVGPPRGPSIGGPIGAVRVVGAMGTARCSPGGGAPGGQAHLVM